MSDSVLSGSVSNGTAAWYLRAADDLAGISDLQTAWARGIAADPEVVALIERLPREHRQPSLLFSVMRWLDVEAAPYDEVRPWLVERWPEVDFARVKCPVLAVAAELDLLAPAASVKAMHAAVSGVEFATIAGAAHSVHWERPAETAGMINAFLGA
jgi:pimeloyl-ACP methyl ester carboxylesterase